jgi:hypothetical protein
MMDGMIPQFDSGLKEVRWLSSGCWCLKRSGVEKMVKAYPDLTYYGDDNVVGKTIHGLYLPMIYDLEEDEDKKRYKKLLSEDWSYCQRWLDIGGKIYADTSIALKHIGKVDYNVWDVEVISKNKQSTPPAGFDLKYFPPADGVQIEGTK